MRLDKIHILFVLESFFPTHRAGTEIYVLNLCRYFKDKGWPVGVLVSTTQGMADYGYEGIPVYTFLVPKKPIVKELNGIVPPRGLDLFIGRIRELQPELVHFHSFGRAINASHLKAVKEMGVRTAFTPHLGGYFCVKGDLLLNGKENCDGRVDSFRCLSCVLQCKGKKPWVSRLGARVISVASSVPGAQKLLPASFFQVRHRQSELKRTQKYADTIFSIAPWIQNAFILNGIHRSQIIPQGITPLFLDIAKVRNRKLGDTLNFAFVGRMHPNKGFHLLSQAWSRLSHKGSVLHVMTTRSKDEVEYYNTQKTLMLQYDNVVWNENFDQQKVAQYYCDMDILILPSTSNEVAPLVIQEASAFGIPVVGSDYIAIGDMVKDGENGLLFRNGDWFQLQQKLQYIIDEPECIARFCQNIHPPVAMSQVAAMVEEAFMKNV